MNKIIKTSAEIAAAVVLLFAAASCKGKTQTTAENYTDNSVPGEFGEPSEEYSESQIDFEYTPEPVEDIVPTVRGICLLQGSGKYALKPVDASNPDKGTKFTWVGSFSEGEEINIIRDVDDTVPVEEFEGKKYYGVIGEDEAKYYIRDIFAAYDADPAVIMTDATTYSKPDIGYPTKTIIASGSFVSVRPSQDSSFYIIKAYNNTNYAVGYDNVRYILKDKVITQPTELYGFNIIKRLRTESNEVIRDELIESFGELNISDDQLHELFYDAAYRY